MSRGADPAAALKRRLASLPAQLRAEVGAALAEVGEMAIGEARRLLQEGPLPSRPGEAPRDTAGALSASLRAVPDPEGRGVRVTSDDPRAVFLEYGTRRMAARPFLRPALTATRPDALRRCAAALRQAAARSKETPS